jgi:hypothetical protein
LLQDPAMHFKLYVCGKAEDFGDVEMERHGDGNEWYAQGKVPAFSRITYRYAIS